MSYHSQFVAVMNERRLNMPEELPALPSYWKAEEVDIPHQVDTISCGAYAIVVYRIP